MKAIRIEKNGGPEVMKLAELPVPEAAAGQVLVKIEAAGVNFIDVYQRTGLYPVQLPYVLGLEGAGTVASPSRAARRKRSVAESSSAPRYIERARSASPPSRAVAAWRR